MPDSKSRQAEAVPETSQGYPVSAKQWEGLTMLPPKVHQSDAFREGYETALREWDNAPVVDKNSTAAFVNPFAEGTAQHEGYEEAVYDLTQK